MPPCPGLRRGDLPLIVIDYFLKADKMVSTMEGRESVGVQHPFLVPRLALMMFMQFFIWGSGSGWWRGLYAMPSLPSG